MAELISSEKKAGRSSLKKMPVRVDLTALVDLAFLLITFFIMTTTLAKPKAMPLIMPAPGPAGAVAASSTMTVCLGKNDRAVWYLGLPDKPLTSPAVVDLGKNGLRRALTETGDHVFKATGKGIMVLVKPSDHSKYGDMVTALDELNITRVPSYAIAKILPQDVDLLKNKGAY
jgi:biopolymer transport protein ExbD